jgi:iron complex transport system permease protein
VRADEQRAPNGGHSGLTAAAGGRPPGWSRSTALSGGRWAATMLVLLAASMVAMVGSLRFGAESIPFDDALRSLFRLLIRDEAAAEAAGPAGVILVQVRLPRVLLGFMVGGVLAAVGAGLQALFRNPLADPYVLGVSSGAALGAALALLLGVGTSVLGFSALPLCAFGGGLLSILIIHQLAARHGRLPVHTLLLAGVILNAIFYAVIMFLTSVMDPNRALGMMAWLMGVLPSQEYGSLAVLTIYLLGGLLILMRQAPALNVMTLGDETARALGVEVEVVKRTVFLVAALLTGAVVSVSGMIGFVGMVIPNAVRMVAGADHRLLLPASALVGGTFLLVADTLARSLLAPGEVPVGVLTALVGGPFFLYLLMGRRTGIGD